MKSAQHFAPVRTWLRSAIVSLLIAPALFVSLSVASCQDTRSGKRAIVCSSWIDQEIKCDDEIEPTDKAQLQRECKEWNDPAMVKTFSAYSECAKKSAGACDAYYRCKTEIDSAKDIRRVKTLVEKGRSKEAVELCLQTTKAYRYSGDHNKRCDLAIEQLFAEPNKSTDLCAGSIFVSDLKPLEERCKKQIADSLAAAKAAQSEDERRTQCSRYRRIADNLDENVSEEHRSLCPTIGD